MALRAAHLPVAAAQPAARIGNAAPYGSRVATRLSVRRRDDPSLMRRNEVQAHLQRLDAELTRIERKQADGESVLSDLEAVVDAWRVLCAEAAAACNVAMSHDDRLERFRWQA